MRNLLSQRRIFTRRAFVLGAFKLGCFSILAGRLYFLQVMKASEYKTLSDGNRIRLQLVPPRRGKIFDRNGNALAVNHHYYRLFAEKEPGTDLSSTLESLFQYIHVNSEQKQLIRERAQAPIRVTQPLFLYDQLDWHDMARIETHSPDLPGIMVDVGYVRYYPYGSLCAHITGYTGLPSKDDTKRHPLLNHPDFIIGKIGVEKAADKTLRGQPGIKRLEVNAYGHRVRELSREDSEPGKHAQLTIDISLQRYITERLGKQGGVGIVMDIPTGDLLAMVSTPNYDPNEFIHGLSPKYWNKLLKNPHHPLINKTIARLYSPGSIFKIVSALTFLRDGVDPKVTLHCSGHVVVSDKRYHCWKAAGHGDVNMMQAMAVSCNCYFYQLAKRVGVEKISETARLLGLGNILDIELPGEKPGIIPNKKWKNAQYKKDWFIGDTLNTVIGQGYVLATPLQLVTMVARIASKGLMVKPRLLLQQDVLSAFDPIPGISADHCAILCKGMTEVVNRPYGSAYASRIDMPKYAMAGKTGTAQVVSRLRFMQLQEQGALSWNHKHHGLFVGYAPAHKPRYACIVVAEHAGGGSRTAAPIAHDILMETQKLFSGLNDLV